ncbi:Cytochrome d ubiquinol oxidase subunit 1 [Salmonella enterica subsp. enterica serovar Rubislaw str. A4-653]|uniref:Cytochrome d ubiquinol oxidase subunit 1 n=1 Tax=Salmonella enterica subsp. enterica serovar Rubislaw str. A4-653 TaxID=913081 RepID=G5QEA7_SALRU|nr:Cytochrome d ubiquinol oxidase subunit 1 [Salmonella enterica subsp. enterica serovar Rubislaw str. A4-653]
MEFDAFFLARLQFAFTVSFHIIFPAITIGLASYLVVLEGLWLKTRNPVWRSLYQFWLKIFAVNFGMGVVSGLVMAYQFGTKTNWSGFSQCSERTGAVSPSSPAVSPGLY